MPDISNIPLLSEALQRSAYNYGRDVQIYVDAKTAAERAYADAKFAALAGEDARFNGILASLLKISDADPNTPEWNEGNNLYTLISDKYVTLVGRIEQSEADIVTLKAFATQTTTDIAAWMTSVNGRIDAEILRAKGEESAIRLEILSLKSALETKDGLTDSAVAAMQGNITTLQGSMELRRQEIAALTLKQTEYGDRLDMLEGKFVGLDPAAVISEFRRGLSGMPSAYGYVPQA